MPKMKSNRGAAKTFRKTGSGKIKIKLLNHIFLQKRVLKLKEDLEKQL